MVSRTLRPAEPVIKLSTTKAKFRSEFRIGASRGGFVNAGNKNEMFQLILQYCLLDVLGHLCKFIHTYCK
jgi:hypothetical protein